MIKFYNSLTRKKQEFKEIEKNKVKIYSCGPTVYNYVHIGNLRAYAFSDILVKTLKYFKFNVTNVMNLTDVDDKTISNSQKELKDLKLNPNEILKKFTQKYSKAFLEDISKLNIDKPKILVLATDSISEMEFLIDSLYKKGFAYISDDGIYFNLSKYKSYGKLTNIDFSHQKYNKENRVVNDEYEKENINDFALWKFKKQENEPSWEIKIGNNKYVGRPGWHIECSAMSMKYLGNKFDIHTGGVDLKFPHHENEIAQSSCALGVEIQANFWMHNEHLLVDGKKMSKSLNNFYTLRDLEKKGYSALALREVFLRSHYRQQLNFTFDSLSAGKSNVKKINDFYQKIINLKPNPDLSEELKEIYQEKFDKFEAALKDDLNTPIAISAVYEFIHSVNKKFSLCQKDIEYAKSFIEKTNKVLSLLEFTDVEIPKKILELAEKRKIARENKDWIFSDKLREEIKALGYEIKDDKNSKSGFILNKI